MSGVRVSPAESIDAMKAVADVPPGELAVIRDLNLDTSKVNPRSMLGAFRFSGDEVDKRV